MKIYLAARYSRREELCEYRKSLELLGHTVTSRWLNGAHQIDTSGQPLGHENEQIFEDMNDPRGATLRQEFLKEDLQDVRDCELLIAFTELPRSEASRGGRHVELGLAIAWEKSIWIVGPRENLFCWAESIEQFDTFSELLNKLF